MFCEPCGRERPSSAACLVCGTVLVRRLDAEIESDLERVRWLLDEVTTWDESVAAASARRSIREFYARQETTLVAALNDERSPVQVAICDDDSLGDPTPVKEEVVPPPPVQAAPSESVVWAPAVEVREEPPPPPRAPPPAPRPSLWQRAWKPFLHESLGWFLGAFLILSGALYLVADAWSDMTSTTRALTVFGLTEAWAVGFSAWAFALSKKRATQPASRSLLRIAALVAPLSVLTLGTSLSSWLVWPALFGGVAMAGFLAWSVSASWPRVRVELTASLALTTLILGVAPVLPSWGAWLVLAPVACAGLAFRRVAHRRTAATVALFLTPVVVVLTRLALAFDDLGPWLAAACVSAAVLACASLMLRSRRQSGVVTVVAVTVLVVSFLVSFAAPKPACVVIALLGAWLTWRLSRAVDAAHPRRVWWLSGTFGFAYLAWQRIDQLVPPIVWVWWNALKLQLGYEAKPMPASYASVFQSLFIAVSVVVAGWLLRRESTRRGAHVWLRSAVVAAIASGALAMVGLSGDVRPAMVALPLLAVPLWVVGLALPRRDALVGAGVLSVLFAWTGSVAVDGAWPAAVIAMVAVLVAYAMPATRFTRPRRVALALTAVGAGVLGLVGGVDSRHAFALHALMAASASLVLAARQLPMRLREGGHVTPSKLPLWLAGFTLLVPALEARSPLLMAFIALAGAAWLQRRDAVKWRALKAAVLSMAVLSPVWLLLRGHASVEARWLLAVAVPAALLWLPTRWRWLGLPAAAAVVLAVPSWSFPAPHGFTFLAVGVAGWLLSRITRRLPQVAQALAVLGVVAAFAPSPFPGGLWTPWPTEASMVAMALVSLGASIFTVKRGRDWRAVLAASLAVGFALYGATSGAVALLGAAVVVLLATPALLAWLTVPVSFSLLALNVGDVTVALAVLSVAATGVALVARWPKLHAWLGADRTLAWAASLTAAVLLIAARVAGPSPVLMPAAVLLPLAWSFATRSGLWLASGVPLTLATFTLPVAPLYAVIVGRALRIGAVRQGLGVSLHRRDADGLALQLALMACSVVGVVRGDAPWLWASAVLMAGGPWLALRVVAAAMVGAVSRDAWPWLVGGLVTLSLLTRHVPVTLRRVLGARSLASVEVSAVAVALVGGVALHFFGGAGLPWWSAAALAVTVVLALASTRFPKAGAALACVAAGVGVATVPGVVALPLVLVVAALLWRVKPFVALAVVALGFQLHSDGLTFTNSLAVALVAAVCAAALRVPVVARVVSAAWARVGRPAEGSLAQAVFWGAWVLAAAAVVRGDAAVLALVPVLLVTHRRVEATASLLLGVVAVWSLLPQSQLVLVLCGAALVLGVAAAIAPRWRVAQVWRQAGWVVALAAAAHVGVALGSAWFIVAWLTVGVTVWLAAARSARAHGLAWATTATVLHLSLGSVGTMLSKGDPQALILPWWALTSAALALVRQLRGGRTSVYAFFALSLAELLLPAGLLSAPYLRESLACLAAAAVLVGVAWRRVVKEDDAVAAWLGQLALLGGALTTRVLASGSMPSLTDAWATLVLGALVAGVSKVLAREGRARASKALQSGAFLLPLAGALCVTWSDWAIGATWLLGLAAFGVTAARVGLKRRGTALAAVAFNAAVVLAAVGSGFDSMQLVLLPLGLTLLVLVRVFAGELPADAVVKLRAVGVGLLYAAVAWKPLFVTSLPALMLCVTVCLAGVALGMVWRVRSYVWLGAGALVVTVLSTLVRSGLAQPRLGALFLSALGLAVVVLMVLLSTRRAELKARFLAVQQTMATWTP